MQTSFYQILLVGFGGMLGSMLRFVTGLFVARQLGGKFPWGTFAVNVIGSFIIGIVLGYSFKKINETGHPVSGNMVLFFATGFCGGFTTFSAFCNEGFLLLKQEQTGLFFAYFSTSVLFGLLATAAGYFITK